MELLQIAKLPIEAVRFVGRQLLTGGWAELPPLPQGPITRPVRASIQYLRTPENIVRGDE